MGESCQHHAPGLFIPGKGRPIHSNCGVVLFHQKESLYPCDGTSLLRWYSFVDRPLGCLSLIKRWLSRLTTLNLFIILSDLTFRRDTIDVRRPQTVRTLALHGITSLNRMNQNNGRAGISLLEMCDRRDLSTCRDWNELAYDTDQSEGFCAHGDELQGSILIISSGVGNSRHNIVDDDDNDDNTN